MCGLKSVEVYDHAEDSWSHMPNMIVGRRDHRLVPIRNKLYAVAGELCESPMQSTEVFDLVSNKFVILKPPPLSFQFDFSYLKGAVSMKNKILLISDCRPPVAWFDVEEQKWSEEDVDIDCGEELCEKNCCFKIPHV